MAWGVRNLISTQVYAGQVYVGHFYVSRAPRAGAGRPYELARAARRAWSFGRGLSLHPDQSKPSDRAEACERDGAGAVLHGCCASCRRERA